MSTVILVCAGVAAIVNLAVFPLEAFLIDRGWVQRFLGIESEGIASVHLWSFCIGARNALAGIGTLVGIWLASTNDGSVGTTIVIIGCGYMFATALFMGIADLLGYWRPRGGSIPGTIGAATLPGVALIAFAIA